VVDLPPTLDRGRHVELAGRRSDPWVRRALLLVLLAVCVVALANVFGQDATTSTAAGPGATLRVQAPKAVRGGLFFQARFDIAARHRIDHPTLELGPGWAQQMQINTIEPAPAEESSRAGRLLLGYDALDPGQRLTVWMQFEANPTGAGRREAGVTLRDGEALITRADRHMTVFP
jgi:hypothetical protein